MICIILSGLPHVPKKPNPMRPFDECQCEFGRFKSKQIQSRRSGIEYGVFID